MQCSGHAPCADQHTVFAAGPGSHPRVQRRARIVRLDMQRVAADPRRSGAVTTGEVAPGPLSQLPIDQDRRSSRGGGYDASFLGAALLQFHRSPCRDLRDLHPLPGRRGEAGVGKEQSPVGLPCAPQTDAPGKINTMASAMEFIGDFPSPGKTRPLYRCPLVRSQSRLTLLPACRQPLHWDYFMFARHAGTGIRIQPENGALDFGRWNILLA
jgi:hypothetical protein